MSEVSAKLSAIDREAEQARERAAEATTKNHNVEGKRSRALYKQLTMSATYTMTHYSAF